MLNHFFVLTSAKTIKLHPRDSSGKLVKEEQQAWAILCVWWTCSLATLRILRRLMCLASEKASILVEEGFLMKSAIRVESVTRCRWQFESFGCVALNEGQKHKLALPPKGLNEQERKSHLYELIEVGKSITHPTRALWLVFFQAPFAWIMWLKEPVDFNLIWAK